MVACIVVGVCMKGGMRGWGACMVLGRGMQIVRGMQVWGACVVVGGHAWLWGGACVVAGGVCAWLQSRYAWLGGCAWSRGGAFMVAPSMCAWCGACVVAGWDVLGIRPVKLRSIEQVVRILSGMHSCLLGCD